jgi:hypothetical protein
VLLPPGRNRSQLDFRIVEAYLAGATSGALLTVMTVWLIGGFAAPLPAIARAILIAGGAVLIWMCQRGPLSSKLTLPQNRRQIPLEVFGSGLVKGAYRFGFEMGTGVRTYLPSPAPYILLLALLFGRLTLASALFVAIGFGLGRAVPLMLQLRQVDREQVTEAFLRGTIQIPPIAAGCVVLVGALILVRG